MKQIIFADDNEPFRLSFSRILERSGYAVMQAEDGREALRKFRESPPDLVICDLIMPEMEGMETIQELTRMKPDIRIIAISGGGRVNPLDYLKVARMMGAVETLAKPFSSEELLASVVRLIGPGDQAAIPSKR
ncbi:MAG TPA: response regulator [Verrucomicrobiales bacterium]|nr:response regulator [Verrucomicrobiales bacterium]